MTSRCRIPVLRRHAWLTDALGSVPCFSDGTADECHWAFIPAWDRSHEGLPFIQLSGGFTIGNNGEGELPQVGNSFQWSDNLSKVKGNHSMKFGADIRRPRFDQTLYFEVSGEFLFDGVHKRIPSATPILRLLAGTFRGSYGKDRHRWKMFAAPAFICSRRIAGRLSLTSR